VLLIKALQKTLVSNDLNLPKKFIQCITHKFVIESLSLINIYYITILHNVLYAFRNFQKAWALGEALLNYVVQLVLVDRIQEQQVDQHFKMSKVTFFKHL
jgi:hypothetical protein